MLAINDNEWDFFYEALEDPSVIYDLHSLPQFAIVCIANKVEELFSRIEDRLVSRLRSSEHVRIDNVVIIGKIMVIAVERGRCVQRRVRKAIEPAVGAVYIPHSCA